MDMQELKTQWHHGTGVIKYDPHRPGMKKRTEWWAVVLVDKEITRYYRWWINRMILNPCEIDTTGQHFQKYDNEIEKVHPPSWDAHISIIRGEKPRQDLMHLWKKYDGETVNFLYKHHVRRSGDTTGGDRPDNYWFIEVFCPKLMDIRTELQRPTNWKLHLTVGRTN